MFSKAASATLICVLALAGCSEPSSTARREAGGCGQAEAPQSLLDASSLVKTNTPLYWVDDQGRLLVGGFDGRSFRVLHQRPFEGRPSLYVSPDWRWLLYGGWMQGMRTEELWLFDTRTEKVTKVFEAPVFGLGIPAFSPDGRTVAIYKNYDDRWSTPQATGLYVIDTERGQTEFIGPIEGSALSPTNMRGDTEWSAKGDMVVFTAGGRVAGETTDTLEFHAFSPATKKFRRIDGHVDFKARKTEFSENGVTIPTLEQTSPRARVMYYERASPDGSLLARVNEKYELVVTGAGRNSVTIDSGDYNMCEGITILIVDWLDQNKYLVYYLNSTFYIAEPATGRKAALIVPGASVDLAW